jgi:predicted metal-dependent peptidase
MSIQSRDEILSKACKDLMFREMYWGFFILMMNKVWRNNLPTAGVSKNGINFQLAINEQFFTDLPKLHREGLIQHEAMHIAYNHLTQWFNFSDKKIANIAMDLVINQTISDDYLPEGGMKLELFPELNLEPDEGTHYYYEKLTQAKEQKEQTGSSGSQALDSLLDQMEGGQGDGNIELPDHSTWEEFDGLSESESRIMKAQLDRVLEQAADMTVKKRGTVPGNISDYLLALQQVEPPKFDWKGYLRLFIGTSAKVYIKKSRRKENIKFTDSAGIKIKRKQNILLGIDTSGSVSESELLEFMSEIYHIWKTGVEVTIIQCDTRIRSIDEYKGTFEMKFHGRGGTEFDPVLEYFNENRNKFNSLIYFTDGECYTDVKPRNPVLWVLSERSTINNDLPGKVIRLEL